MLHARNLNTHTHTHSPAHNRTHTHKKHSRTPPHTLRTDWMAGYCSTTRSNVRCCDALASDADAVLNSVNGPLAATSPPELCAPAASGSPKRLFASSSSPSACASLAVSRERERDRRERNKRATIASVWRFTCVRCAVSCTQFVWRRWYVVI